MKILKVHFKNINALYGEWEIDFTHEAYKENSIFLLTGPTGSGKSTVLDALCLALYGKTPRLDTISKSTNEVMSRQTGECFSCVTFQTQKGVFVCRWEQRRAKKKSTGALQNAEVEIAEAETGTILDTSIKGVAKLVEELTGMDYERFTRTIVLAQGNFNAFLKAKVEEKSSILEEITGTEIYTQISLRVHEKSREEKEKLNLIKAESAHITLLPKEELALKEEMLQKMQAEAVAIETERKSFLEQEVWLQGIESLEKELAKITEDKKNHALSLSAFEPQKKALDIALKASELEAPYAELLLMRKSQGELEKQISQLEFKRPLLEKELKEQSEKAQKKATELFLVKENLDKQKALFKEVRLLDHEIKQDTEFLQKQKKELEESQKKWDLQKKACEDEAKKLTVLAQKILEIKKWQKEHKADAFLVTEFAGVMEQIKYLLSLQEEGKKERLVHTEKKRQLEEQTKIFEQKNIALEKQKKDELKILQSLQEEEKKYTALLDNKLLREYKAQKEALQREELLLVRIASLEEIRHDLEDQKPCPLCGSLEHPYALGNIPKNSTIAKQIQDLTKHIEAIEKSSILLEKWTKENQNYKIQLLNTQNEWQKGKEDVERYTKEFQDANQKIEERLNYYKTKYDELLTKLNRIGVEEIPNMNLLPFQNALQERLRMWQEKEKLALELEKENLTLESHIKGIALLASELEKSTLMLSNQYAEQDKRLLEKREKRHALFGEKNVDHVENSFTKNIQETELALNILKEQEAKYSQEVSTLIAQLKSLQEQRVANKNLLLEKESLFSELLVKSAFENETLFIHGSLAIENRKKIQADWQALEDRQKSLLVLEKEKNEKLLEEKQKAKSTLSKEHLVEKIQSFNVALKENTEQSITIKNIVAQQKFEIEKFKVIGQKIEEQEKECSRFEKLHSFIGSNDGKKFRNFAQGLTFERLIAHANVELEKMSDRYILLHDPEKPLVLNVLDVYQAGEIRSTLNLSGGESFLVSLALALGLSKMVSHKVRVDSLFLDEGFGTLDEESLEVALNTLSHIQEDGKLIGLISHIPLLKERINVHIQLLPQNSGKSTLEGAGCRRVG